MDWIKRNLFFVIGAVVALLLMVGAGFYTWTGWSHNSAALEDLNSKYEELKRLSNLNPNPGSGKVDNTKAAREQVRQVSAAFAQVANQFKPISAIPEGTNVSVQAFAARLSRTIYDLQREATNAGVLLLQPKYEFSFRQQNQAVKFAPGSVGPLAVQLGEVKALCDLLIAAKINALESIQRERVSSDDLAGQQTDYLEMRSETNDLAVLSPYQITFRSFSPELAQVLCGFAASANGVIIKSVNVEPAAPTAADVATSPPVTYYSPPPVAVPTFPTPRSAEDGVGRGLPGRYDRGPSAPVATTPAPAPVASTAPRTVLNEKQLKVTMLVQVVKLLPKK